MHINLLHRKNVFSILKSTNKEVRVILVIVTYLHYLHNKRAAHMHIYSYIQHSLIVYI